MLKNTFMNGLGCALIMAMAAIATQPVSAQAAPKLTPHKALYDVSLTSVQSGSQISDIYGEMFFEWKQTCDAWVTDHRSNLVYQYTDGKLVRITTDFVTYESLDGKSLDFTSRRTRNGEIFEEVRGHADLDDNHVGEAAYAEPMQIQYDLPAQSYFPMDHTKAILEKAETVLRIEEGLRWRKEFVSYEK